MTSARPSAALQPPADTRRIGRIRSETISTAAIFALTIILILASRFVSPALGSWDQVDTIITLASFLIVVAFGQGLVILVGGLDLSIASMITLGGVLSTYHRSGVADRHDGQHQQRWRARFRHLSRPSPHLWRHGGM